MFESRRGRTGGERSTFTRSLFFFKACTHRNWLWLRLRTTM
ncbi:MAG: hypothetical protein NZ840_11725 [Anaerolineales bacterium]|nr:hypothetical protein [Anaerolineales bacterium]MDW8162704.1 hypothetical protein [Anaerolineales bacterium]